MWALQAARDAWTHRNAGCCQILSAGAAALETTPAAALATGKRYQGPASDQVAERLPACVDPPRAPVFSWRVVKKSFQ
jgi:hypothetical protein